MMPTRAGSAMPWATRYFTPQVMSSCILSPHCLLPGVEELLAVAGRAAEVRAAGPRSRGWRGTARTSRSPRCRAPTGPPCGKIDDRQVLRRDALRERQVGGDLEAVRRRVAHRPSSAPAPRAASFSRIRYCSVSFFVWRSKRYVSPGSTSLAADTMNSVSSVVERAEADLTAREPLLQQAVVGLERLVLPVVARSSSSM